MIYTLGTVDLGGDIKSIILNQLNVKLNKNFLPTDFHWFNPRVTTADEKIKLTTAENPTPQNTAVDLVPFSVTGYYGRKRVFYNRISFTEFQDRVVPVVDMAKTLVSQYLPELSEQYGIQLTVDDIVDGPVTYVDGLGSFTLTANPNSYLYIDSVGFTVGVPAAQPPEDLYIYLGTIDTINTGTLGSISMSTDMFVMDISEDGLDSHVEDNVGQGDNIASLVVFFKPSTLTEFQPD